LLLLLSSSIATEAQKASRHVYLDIGVADHTEDLSALTPYSQVRILYTSLRDQSKPLECWEALRSQSTHWLDLQSCNCRFNISNRYVKRRSISLCVV
jgi:hypothetical protein